ncbi:MAG: hypothetical protein KAX49_00240 [Halanaerobiales bacterium]|nr:hypothetical protein [Halanaerobiales bacterium]
MNLKFSENFLSLRWRRLPSELITSEILQFELDNENSESNSQKKLLEIEQQLTKAHELYFDKQYQQAIETYKNVQSMIFQRLFAKDSSDSSNNSSNLKLDLDILVNQRLFEPVIAYGLKVIEGLKPVREEIDLELIEDMPVQVIDSLILNNNIGVNFVSQSPKDAIFYGQLAAKLVREKEWEKAELFYKRALKALGKAETPELQTIRASIALSLGAIYTVKGELDKASRYMRYSSKYYQIAKDRIGEAQINFNLAAIYAKQRVLDKAKIFLKKAQDLSQELESATVANTHIQKVSDYFSVKSLGAGLNASFPVVFWSGKNSGVSTKRLPIRKPRMKKKLGVYIGNRLVTTEWDAKGSIPKEQIVNQIYKWRINRTKLEEITFNYQLQSDFAVQLPHIYYYIIPTALGDCYHAIGEYNTAESYYLKVANYEYINTQIEIPDLWIKLANNVLAWGDSLYKNSDYTESMDIYRKVVDLPGSGDVVWAKSYLYKHSKLRLVGNKVKSMLEKYENGVIEAINPKLKTIVLEVRARLLQLEANLDFWGMPMDIIPIWSFEYLQTVARYFAGQAVQAEREFVHFWDRGETESLTRQQVEQGVALVTGELELAGRRKESAEDELAIYQAGKELATLRKNNAQDNYYDYSSLSAQRIYADAAIATLGSGSSVDWDKIEKHIRELQEEGRTSGKTGHLIGARTLERGRKTREYELGSMKRQINELGLSEEMANKQWDAARTRVEVADQMEVIAKLKKEFAEESLAAFDNQLFTPDVWYQMGLFMRGISNSYLYMALNIAKMMQKAYNFENGLKRHYIKEDYSTNTIKGMFAGDALLLDIDSFTHDLITSVHKKEIPIKHTFSLVESYPYLFETQFRQSGKMEFETRIEDFDLAYPGTYGRKIKKIEISIQGILPKDGIKGTLTNGGINRYRTTNFDEVKFRIQPKETLILSEYRVKEDAIIFPDDSTKLGLFEGVGVIGSWALEIPRFSNDLDFNMITDISITFYYNARYDERLEHRVREEFATLDGMNQKSRIIPLRWAFPDRYFYFQDTGKLEFMLDPSYFPFNELNPKIRNLNVLIITEPEIDPESLVVRFCTPNHNNTIKAKPNSKGEIAVTNNHPWQPLLMETAVGDYHLEISKEENPQLNKDGAFKLEGIKNIVLILEYDFTPRM